MEESSKVFLRWSRESKIITPLGFHHPYQQEKMSNIEEMLAEFILVSETRFQNTEAIFKKQQAPIQGLINQIGQLAKSLKQEAIEKDNGVEDNKKDQIIALIGYKPLITYLAKLGKDYIDKQIGKFLEIFKHMHINLLFVEAL
ncbi:F-box/LRR-repeat protein 13-like [Gossypium australe]|uniref:F-box/LRR-repeat protein 13-like n=1 Tax=Gossypium australe TaxID=47621 RepID=A0A5B6WM19_9ROSI|nr:F-box/LRR-repeat protein 13-like [Gossypium australe]